MFILDEQEIHSDRGTFSPLAILEKRGILAQGPCGGINKVVASWLNRNPAVKWCLIAVGIFLAAAVVFRPTADERTVNYHAVSDPSVIAHLWDEYIQDAIPTIANQPFSSPEQINRHYAIQYAIRVICRKQAYQKLNDGFGRIDPQLVSQYIRQYLNTCISNIDPPKDFAYTAYYDTDREAFDIEEMAVSASYVKYNEMTPWAIRLDSVTKNEAEGSYTVKLVQLASAKSTRVVRETTCVLQERPDGTMYFKSIHHAYPTSAQSIVIDGRYQKLSPTRLNVSSTDKEWPLHVLASFDGKVFARSDNGKEGSAYQDTLKVYDARNFNELASFASPKQFEAVKVTQSGYLIVSRGNVLKLDRQLKVIEITDIPSDVAKEAFGGDWWGGFDVSKDGRYFVYSSQSQGLKLYDVKTGTERLLARHLPENTKFQYVPYIQGPAFVDHDSKVVARVAGYESISGYVIIDLRTGRTKKLTMDDLAFNGIYTFDSNFPYAYGLSARTVGAGTSKPDIYITRLDYGQMEMKQFKVRVTDDAQRVPLSAEFWPLVTHNDKYLAYVSVQYAETGDSADNVYHIVRVDLKTLKAETLLSIKAGCPTVLGILEDGRVIFSYYFENTGGLGVTEK